MTADVSGTASTNVPGARPANAATAAATTGTEDPTRLSVPMPPSPKPGIPLAEADPELYAAWRKQILEGFAHNEEMFQRILHAFMGPYWTTVWVYRILMGIGIGGFVVAAILGVMNAQWPATALFGGLSVVAFLTYFLSRPLQALEENLQFITWLGIIYNTYWTRLANAQDPATFQNDLAQTTDAAIAQLKQLVDAHSAASGKRPTPG